MDPDCREGIGTSTLKDLNKRMLINNAKRAATGRRQVVKKLQTEKKQRGCKGETGPSLWAGRALVAGGRKIANWVLEPCNVTRKGTGEERVTRTSRRAVRAGIAGKSL